MKTEDIPNLEDAKFAPKVIKDIAQNILSFLKANATKEGHTYWLFKGASLFRSQFLNTAGKMVIYIQEAQALNSPLR